MSFLIPQLIDSHARATPHHEAIRFLGLGLSYQSLSDSSNQLANCLLAKNVSRGDRVGIYMDKCLELGIALYGIMKSGAAYVPLDPLAPPERTAEIIRSCGIKVLLSADNKRDRLERVFPLLSQQLTVVGTQGEGNALSCSETWEQVFETYPCELPNIKIIESDLAYIIYTSGSTGVPKGIMHTHHSGLSFARWAAQEYQLKWDDRLSNHAPLHFDLSIFDFFAGAVAGACTVIIPEEYTKLPASYSQLISDENITVLFTVPFALIQLLLHGAMEERDLGCLRWVIFGGEPFPVKYLRQLIIQLPDARFDNMYGPAEVNGCSHHTIAELGEFDSTVPIGKISQIAEALVVDAEFETIAPGESGELLVRTPTMMQGYWGRPDLNRNAFYEPTDSSEFRRVFFRTGDLVQVSDDGEMWFLGRKDRQVKVRGYRIELDEVEVALVAHENLEEAAVFAVRRSEVVEIHAAYTLKSGESATAAEILQYLKSRLAAYSVPSVLTLREDFPRTSTGKIDRQSLSKEVIQ